jgi:multicomponent Na+:H+ antiporter subunit B
MLQVLLILLFLTGALLLFESKVYRNIIYFGVFSLIASLCYLLLGAPDVAMAEAGISVFATVFLIVSIEKYYGRKDAKDIEERPMLLSGGRWIMKVLGPIVLTVFLFVLFVYFMPEQPTSTYLKDYYLARFVTDVGGQNAVAAILLGYRVYDTLFEALILVVSVVAVSHMSWTEVIKVSAAKRSEIENSLVAALTLRIICPVILIFGVYLILNGHIAAGGGFLGGLAIAFFFVCRYFIYGIYDIPVDKVMRIEELVFMSFAFMTLLFVSLLGANIYLPERFTVIYQDVYLMVMNGLIGLKVACGFFIIFYRYVAVERFE